MVSPFAAPIHLVVLVGARPNFMKAAPLMEVLAGDSDFSTTLVHTEQHYDHNISGQFFNDLDLPEPRFYLGVGPGSQALQTAEVMKRIEPVLVELNPVAIIVIVVGDVNTTLTGALVSAKLGVKVVHVEAGQRSFDRAIATDSISDLFLVTEESGRVNLLREGVPPSRIHFTGNLMIDSMRRHLERPATIEYGTNRLAGTTKESILAAWAQGPSAQKEKRIPPLWDRRAVPRCLDALREFFFSQVSELGTP